MSIRAKSFTYKNRVCWREARIGTCTAADDKPPVEVATPPEFRGHPGCWTPEDFYVAALNGCLMTTFLAVAQTEELEFISFECEAEGILEPGPSKQLMFTRVVLRPTLELPADEDPDLAQVVLELAEQRCLISNSVKSEIILEPTITLKA